MPYRTVKPPFGRPVGAAPLRSVVNCASVPLPRAAFAYSSHRGGVRPVGALSCGYFGEPEGSFNEPPSNRAAPPRADIQSLTAKDTSPLAILVTGRSTLEARPPAIWFRASRITTIRPSDQSKSISYTATSVDPYRRFTTNGAGGLKFFGNRKLVAGIVCVFHAETVKHVLAT